MRHVLLVAALAFLLPAAAQAAEKDAVVATVDGARLSVRDGGKGQFCKSLDRGTPDGPGSSGCGEVPTGRFGSDVSTITFGDRSFAGGVVPADGTTVELEFADESRLRVETTTGDAYTGRYRGTLRFFLVQLPAGQGTAVLLRRFDAAGALVGASGIEEGGDAPIGDPVVVYDHRGTRVSVAATRSFSPSALRIDRTDRSVCLTVSSRRSRGTHCSADPPYVPPLDLATTTSCGSSGTLVSGFTGHDVPKVVLVLGSGRRLTVPTRSLVGTVGTARRALAVTVPLREAVREAIALDGAGKAVDRQTIGSAPGPLLCGNGSSTFGTGVDFLRAGDESTPAPPEGQEVVAGAAPGAQLVARDEGDYLCLNIDRLAADRHDCQVPQPDEAAFPFVVRRATAQRTAAGGVLTGDAVAVRVQIDGRRTLTATVTDGPGYTGRYRGVVRFFLVETPGRHKVTSVQVLDAAGKTLTQLPGPDDGSTDRGTAARGRGFRFFGARFDYTFKLPGFGTQRSRGSCVGLIVGRERPSEERCVISSESDFPSDDVLGEISCSPRIGVLFGRLTKGLRGVTFDLAGGGRLIAGTVRIPKRYGGMRLWVVRVPPSAHIVRMNFLGLRPTPRFGGRRGKASGRYDIPAPRRQCGYFPRDPTF